MIVLTWKKNLTNLLNTHNSFVKNVKISERYYENKNDITLNHQEEGILKPQKQDGDPLRKADNRVSHNYHQLLTNQKAAYALSEPPVFDVDDKKLNELINETLGDTDEFVKESKALCINATNAGVGWLHVWIDEDSGRFQYASIDPKNVIPIYTKSLKKGLVGLLYFYEDMVEDKEATVYEYWDKDKVSRWYGTKSDDLKPYESFNQVDNTTGEIISQTNEYPHNWGEVPFIFFGNNITQMPDLDNYKKHIDVYDKVYSGFVNDIEDVQEIILILTNYGGTDLAEFKQDLADFKIIKTESQGAGDKSGVQALSIEIPVEARKVLLETTKEQIYESGQAVNPNQEIGQSVSGVALKQIYSMLELKVGLMETEFRMGYTKLIRFILQYLGKDPHKYRVKQTWTRTRIDNDLEQAEVVAKVAPFTSAENLAKANPVVDDWENELKLQKQEDDDDHRAENDFRKVEDNET